MSEIIRELREYADGNPASYPFGALAENIILSDGSVLEDALGNVNLFENGSVIDQIQEAKKTLNGIKIVEQDDAKIIGDLKFVGGDESTVIGSVGSNGLSKINVIGGVNGSRWQNDLYLIDGSGIGGFIKPISSIQRLEYNAGTSHMFQIGGSPILQVTGNSIEVAKKIHSSSQAEFSGQIISRGLIKGATGEFGTLNCSNINTTGQSLAKTVKFTGTANQGTFLYHLSSYKTGIPYLCYYDATYVGYLRTQIGTYSTGTTSNFGVKNEPVKTALERHSRIGIGVCCKLSGGGAGLTNSMIAIFVTQDLKVFTHRYYITQNSAGKVTGFKSELYDGTGKSVKTINITSLSKPWQWDGQKLITPN